MTAAAKNSSNGSGSQPWCRTVYVRQGRFFLTLVTVRVSPCQPASYKVYKTGRFTVREELQWVGQQTASQCQAYVVLADREAAWRQTALRRLQQELDEPADSKPLCSSGSTQHVASEVQQQAGCSTPGKAAHGSSLQQQSSPWWTRLLTAFRWVATLRLHGSFIMWLALLVCQQIVSQLWCAGRVLMWQPLQMPLQHLTAVPSRSAACSWGSA